MGMGPPHGEYNIILFTLAPPSTVVGFESGATIYNYRCLA